MVILRGKYIPLKITEEKGGIYLPLKVTEEHSGCFWATSDPPLPLS